jgi:hypothetical protein
MVILAADFPAMEILSVAEAKPKMARLINQALAGKPVVIRKGDKLVKLSEFVVPDPIPDRPVGFFRRRPRDYAIANRAATNARAVR